MTRPTTQAISPFFIVSNVDQTIAFYRDKLGFETRFQQPDQSPFFAIVGRDGAQIFVKSDKDTSPLPNAKRHPSMRWDAFVYAPTPMHSRSNLPIMEQHSACRSRILTTVFAGSRFATLTATSCSSADQGRQCLAIPGNECKPVYSNSRDHRATEITDRPNARIVAVRMTDRHSCGGFLVGSATQLFSLDPGWHYMAWRFLAFLPGVIVFAVVYLLNSAIASTDRGTLADGYFCSAANGEVLTTGWHFAECCKEKAPAYLVGGRFFVLDLLY